jgi:hypothetical protein
MKRVFLLVLLIVSLVQFDWERDRIYLASSIVSTLLVVWCERVRCHKFQEASAVEAFTTGESVSVVLANSGPSHDQAGVVGVDRTTPVRRDIALITGNGGTGSEQFRNSAA